MKNCKYSKSQETQFYHRVLNTIAARLHIKSKKNKNTSKKKSSSKQQPQYQNPFLKFISVKKTTEKEKGNYKDDDDQKTLIPSTPTTPRTTKSSSRRSRHTSHLLPSLETFELFYAGYPKHSLIMESASIIGRIENGCLVTEWEKNLLRTKLGTAILKRCSPGTAEFLSWQVFLDLWKRIPEN
ncbi:5285_t:CDS:1 [Ambispora gerdemannii]|uniref:5285_t:CDS:1 n=1 Tax=Ambispora gerdemannii TaxID=144530 RepID=A0A9N8YM66_9GLOM|nr:5285_t:CDS:1 [Ambispora gerdemannii]